MRIRLFLPFNQAILITMYESFYGLTHRPFQLTPDPEFFFASKLHKRALSYLEYGLAQCEGFIVITGEIGTGKTTIANSLLNNIDNNNIISAQIVTPKLSPDELVRMVASKFKLDIKGQTKTETLDVLETYLIQLQQQGKRALLLVDEAQNLPLESIEELRMLSNFQVQGKPLLQSFLLGQEELQDIIKAPNMEQFRQRIVASCHLVALGEEETRSYIEFRLHHAGWNGSSLFSDAAFKAIFAFTGGVPRKINTFVDRTLLFGFLEELQFIDEDVIEAVTKEVADEMFVQKDQPLQEANAAVDIKSVDYYKDMLLELVDTLDNTINQKIKLTRYIDKLLKKKYKTYIRLKSD